MSFDYKKYISGEVYENSKKYFKCTFPKPSGLLCNLTGTLNDITHHLALSHLKQYRYKCRVCHERFLEKVQYENHKSRRNCKGLLSMDLEEREFHQNSEAMLWRCTNVFVQQIQGPELAEHKRKVKMMKSSRGNGRNTPCYDEDEGRGSLTPQRSFPPPFSGFRGTTPEPPQSNPKPWEPPRPVSPYRPPPNYTAMSQTPSDQRAARSRMDAFNSARARRGRSRTPITLPSDDEPTGVYSLVPKKPQEIRRRSVSRVNYGHERAKSPIGCPGSGEIEETSRLKAAYQTQSRSTAKVPNMRNSRNAVLLEVPTAVPRRQRTREEKQAEMREKMARNFEVHKARIEREKRAEREKNARTSRSRSP